MHDIGDRVVAGEERHDRLRIGDVPLDPQRQGLDALEDVEGVLRAHAGAEVAQALGARPHVERRRAEAVEIDQTVIAGVGLGHGREFARAPPVEAAAVDQDAADREAVAAQPLGRRVQHQVGTVLERPAQVGRRESVVDQQRQAVAVRDLGDRGDVQHLEPRIADGLGEQQAGLGPDRRGEGGRVARVDEAGLDAEARQGQLEQVGAAAIERLRGDDVAAGIHERHDREVQRCLAAGGRDGADAALERCHPLLQHRDRRIGDAGVDVAGAFQVEQGRRLRRRR